MSPPKFSKEKEDFERLQRRRINSFRARRLDLDEWNAILADECQRSTEFFYKVYGSIVDTMKDHDSYRHMKGVDINRGKYYMTGDPVRLVNMANYTVYELLLPQHPTRLDGARKDVVSDFSNPDVDVRYFDRFFELCGKRHEEADSVYGELDAFTARNHDFEHLEDGFLRNRLEYHQTPWQQPLIDIGNYIVYEARKPLHRVL